MSTSPLRVLYVWDANYPWDVRTQKICRSLSEAGFGVAITARNTRGEVEEEALPEGRVFRMSRLAGALGSLNEMSSFPAFANPRWVRHLTRVAQRHRPSIIVVRDLPLTPTAIWTGRRCGIPVVMDMAENYPAMIQDIWESGRARWTDALVRNPAIVRMVERWCVARVAHTVTVVEESAERLLAMGVEPSRVSVVSNTPPRRRAMQPRVQSSDRTVRGVYLGLMELPRGVLEVLDAVAMVRDWGVKAEFDFIGDGRDFGLVRERALALDLHPPLLRLHGRLSNPEALAIVARAEVGLVPHHAVESWHTTIPNKLFDYMAAGLAVVSTDAAPAKRIVEATGAGVIYPSRDAKALAEILASLTDPIHRQAYSRSGQEAIRTRYHWERDVGTLIGVLYHVSAEFRLRVG